MCKLSMIWEEFIIYRTPTLENTNDEYAIAGKYRQAIWELFSTTVAPSAAKRHLDVTCKSCGTHFLNAQPGRHLVRHVHSCAAMPAQSKQRYAPNTPPSTPKKPKKRRSVGTPSSTRKMPPHAPPPPEHGLHELELDLAMAFYATGISFRVLEDPKLNLLFKHLRPDFKLPSRYKLAGPLLKTVYAREKQKVLKSNRLNLLMKNALALPIVDAVLDKARWISKYVLKRYILLDRFSSKQKTVSAVNERRRTLCLHVPTRWYTCEACLRTVVKNKVFIQAALEDKDIDNIFKKKEQKDKLRKAKVIIADAVFWENAGTGLLLLKPINATVATFESDGRSIGFLLDQRMDINGINEEKLQLSIKEAVTIATRHVVDGEVALKRVQDDLHALVRAKHLWSAEVKNDHATYKPINWWLFRSQSFRSLRDLALLICCIPTSSAASERSWSIHDIIHSKRRNRHAVSSVETLVFIYTNHKGVDHVLYDMYSDAPTDDVNDKEDNANFALQTASNIT
ncbi:hypothetical protein BBJ28_00012453 [Nothophytophthora sp. Chile5]|nr:hypothetical protein BBJ28_00012453 [Nothophytophthora sp. Chile5]